LNWLLREKTGVVARRDFFTLESIPTAEARRHTVPRWYLRSVTFSRPVQLGREETVTAAHRYSTSAASVDAIQALMGVDDLRGMLPAEALAEGRIETFCTRYSGTPTSGDERPKLSSTVSDELALRHMDEDPEAEVEIETASGKSRPKAPEYG